MSWSRWVSYLASAALGVAACRASPRLQVLGESTRLKQSEASPNESAIFDGKVLRLRGARGETLGVQLRISDGRVRQVRLDLPNEQIQVSGFSVRYLDVKEPSTSMYGASRGPGAYPDVLVPSKGAVTTSDLAYFDVGIQQTAQPGQYRGELSGAGQSILSCST
jgi:hypothetical protein